MSVTNGHKQAQRLQIYTACRLRNEVTANIVEMQITKQSKKVVEAIDTKRCIVSHSRVSIRMLHRMTQRV